MMAVTISTGASLRVGKPAPLFEGRKSMRISVVFNWFEELGWLVPLVPAQRAGPLKLAKPARKAILTR